MDWLSNWDDLVHGTVVFAAAVPFLVAGGVAWLWPERLWVALVVGLGVSLAWLFGWPEIPPGSSDDAMVTALVVGVVVVGLGVIAKLGWWRWVIGVVLWCGVGWLLYPAWLEVDGGVGKRALVCSLMAVSIVGTGRLAGWGCGVKEAARSSGWVLVVPTAGLAALLQMGGSTQFTQTAGALAAALVGVMLVLWKKGRGEMKWCGDFWGMMFAVLAWSGWLFAEVSVAAVMVVAGAAGGGILIGKKSGVVVSVVLSAVAVWMGWMVYGGGSEGY